MVKPFVTAFYNYERNRKKNRIVYFNKTTGFERSIFLFFCAQIRIY